MNLGFWKLLMSGTNAIACQKLVYLYLLGSTDFRPCLLVKISRLEPELGGRRGGLSIRDSVAVSEECED